MPQRVESYSTARVLAMDYICGQKITAVSPLVLAEAGSRELADDLFRAYLHQVILGAAFGAAWMAFGILRGDQHHTRRPT